MPLLPNSSFRSPIRNGHLQTILPALLRNVKLNYSKRERISTPDNDFIDLDWSQIGADKLVLLIHGLEASAHEAYMKGMVRAINRRGWDAVVFNLRGCSGEPNLMPYSYHAGKTEDLDTVFRHIYSQYPQYLEVTAAGYSLGGNLLVKFLGEEKWDTIHRIERAAAISAPANLLAASQTIGSGTNRLLYENRFLRFLRATVRAKWPAMNGLISEAEFAAVKTLKAWDDRITAPLNGFRNAEDYYAQNSCAQFIPAIQTPLYMVTAANDPFFSEPCYPVAEARQNPLLTLEIPQNGGHVGFITFGNKGEFWSETRVGDWLCNGNL